MKPKIKKIEYATPSEIKNAVFDLRSLEITKMSARDVFAACALIGMTSSYGFKASHDSMMDAGELSYMMADIMLAERRK